jgi:hypothetical protein
MAAKNKNRRFWEEKCGGARKFRQSSYVSEKMGLYNKAYTKDTTLLSMIPKSMADQHFIKPYLQRKKNQVRR